MYRTYFIKSSFSFQFSFNINMWLINWLIIANCTMGSISAILRTSTNSIIYKSYKDQRLLTAAESTPNALVFFRIYNAPILFQNLQERSLVCRERCTLQARYPLWSTDRISVRIITWQPTLTPSSRGLILSATRERGEQVCEF